MPQPTFPFASITVRVVPRDLHWEVRAPGRPRRLIDSLCTKDRAIQHASQIAEELRRSEGQLRVAVVVERSDGSVEALLAA